MLKRLIILGMAVLLIVVGLSGCFEKDEENGESGYVSVSEVCEHPNTYLNQEVTIRGYYTEDDMLNYKAVVANRDYGIYGDAIQLVGKLTGVTLIKDGEYLFTGTLLTNSNSVLKGYMPAQLSVDSIQPV